MLPVPSAQAPSNPLIPSMSSCVCAFTWQLQAANQCADFYGDGEGSRATCRVRTLHVAIHHGESPSLSCLSGRWQIGICACLPLDMACFECQILFH